MVRCSSGLQANVMRLVGNHRAFTSFSPCSLSLTIKKTLTSTSEWIYFVVACSRGWKARTCHLSSIQATRSPGVQILFIPYQGDAVLPTARDVGLHQQIWGSAFSREWICTTPQLCALRIKHSLHCFADKDRFTLEIKRAGLSPSVVDFLSTFLQKII